MNIGFDAKRAFHNKSGLGNYSRDTILSLAKYFPEENYFYFNPKPSDLFSIEKGQIISPATFLDKKWTARWRTYGMRKYFETLKLDVYHGLSNELPFGKKTFSTKEIVSIHDLIFLRYPETYKAIDRKIYTKKFSEACRIADLVVATSESTKRDIIHFFGTEADKIKVIYQSCNDLFLSHTAQHYDMSAFNLPEKYILSVGTIEERKNQLVILEAIKDTDLHLVLIGKEKAYAEKLKTFIEKNELTHRIHFIANASNEALVEIYKNASAFVYASFYEGFGIPILEAMASGVPVIASHASSLPEVGGEAVLYFNPNSSDELNTALSRILNDTAFKNSLILKGKNQAQLFSKEKMVQQLMAIYK
jgi:glycosyltransferase involved in cell wall biosynthesis